MNTSYTKVFVVSEHFYPTTGATGQLVTDLVSELDQQGLQIEVITSTPGSNIFPYRVHRFPCSVGSSATILNKSIKGLNYFLHTFLWLLSADRNHAILLIVSNPPFIGLLGPLIKLTRGLPYVFLFQDIFPRSASLTGVLPSRGPLPSLWKLIMSTVLNYSNHTIVLSDAMRQRALLDFKTRSSVSVIPNWSIVQPCLYSKKNNPIAIERGIRDTFTVQYSGNFGRLHDIITILESARLLQRANVHFDFVGGGAKSTQIRTYIKQLDMHNISLYDYQPTSELSTSLTACDVAIVSLIPGAHDTVAPSKLYGILSSSIPVILITSEPSELAKQLLDYSCGYVVNPGDVLELTSIIKNLSAHPQIVESMGRNSRKLYQINYGLKKSAQQYKIILTQTN